MVKRMVFILAFVLVCGVAHAATIYLKNGSAISGKILSRTADSAKLDVNGVTLTYYNDEIDRVDEAEAPVPAEPPSATPVPAQAVPEVVEAVAPAAPVAVEAAPPESPPAPLQAQPEQPTVEATLAPAAPPAVTPAPVEPKAKDETAAPKPDAYAGMNKKALILKFIDVFGTKKSMNTNFAQMMTTLPANQAEIFQKTFKVDEIIEELVPLYDKYFTEEDLKGFIDFYSAPTGRKLVDTIPLIMNESVEVSAKYFESHMPEVVGDLKKAGVPENPPAKP